MRDFLGKKRRNIISFASKILLSFREEQKKNGSVCYLFQLWPSKKLFQFLLHYTFVNRKVGQRSNLSSKSGNMKTEAKKEPKRRTKLPLLTTLLSISKRRTHTQTHICFSHLHDDRLVVIRRTHALHNPKSDVITTTTTQHLLFFPTPRSELGHFLAPLIIFTTKNLVKIPRSSSSSASSSLVARFIAINRKSNCIAITGWTTPNTFLSLSL